MAQKGPYSPVTLLANIAAVLALLVLGAILGIIAYDQAKHWTDPDYVADKRARHNFFCFEQSGFPVQDRDNRLLVLQEDVETLLDVARQELAPTDFLGKLQRFALCAEFSNFSAGGIGFAGPEFERQLLRFDASATENVDNPVLQRRREIAQLAAIVPDFPAQIFDRIDVKLADMQQEFEFGKPVPPELSVETDGANPGTPPTPDPAAYLLVVGADKTEAATISQYQIISRILDNSSVTGASGPPQVYRLGSWQRTAIPFARKGLADAALWALSDVLPYGGYVRNTQAWCAAPTPADQLVTSEGVAITVLQCEG